MHGYRRGKPVEYGIRLREKQKLKRFYGVLERQFRRYFALACRSAGEHRRAAARRSWSGGSTTSSTASASPPNRTAARQLVAHGHVMVNGRKCNIPSLLLKPGDVITVKARRPQPGSWPG